VAVAELKEQKKLDFVKILRDFGGSNAGRWTDRMA